MSEHTIKRAGKFGDGTTYEIEATVVKVSINGVEVKSEAMADFIELNLKGDSKTKRAKK